MSIFDGNCLIFQLFLALEIPQSLKNSVANTDYTFFGVEIVRDVEKLRDSYVLEVRNAADWTGNDRIKSRVLCSVHGFFPPIGLNSYVLCSQYLFSFNPLCGV